MHSVLIAADDTVSAEAIRSILVGEYGPVAVSICGGELPLPSESECPDMVLFDVRPGEAGTALRAAADLRLTRDVPAVLIVPEEGAKQVLLSCAAQGIACLVRPVREAGLRACIDAALEMHALRRRVSESEKHYRALVDASPVAIGIADAEKILYINPEGARLLGPRSPEEIIGKPLLQFVHPEHHGELRARLRRHLQGEGSRGGVEQKWLRLDGTVLEVEVQGSFVQFAGKPAVQAVVRDISRRKSAENKLRESEERYRTLFNEATEGIALADFETGILLDCNQAFIDIFGYERAEIIGRPQSVLHPGASSSGDVSESFLRHRKEADGHVLIAPIVTKSGSLRRAEIKARVIDIAGRRTVQVFFRDITDDEIHRREREMTLELLGLLNDDNTTEDLIRGVTRCLQKWTGCEAVGVRIRDEHDFPYFETRGFSADFVRSESRLCRVGDDGLPVLDPDGNPVLECMCGNILCGRFNPAKPFFSARGSFWTNSTSDLLAGTTEKDRQARTRNRCNGEGYESVALIALRSGAEILGLLQLNDRSKGRFSSQFIQFLECACDQIAIAISQRETRRRLAASEARLRDLSEASGELIWETDAGGIVKYVNDRSLDLLGYAPREMIGQSSSRFWVLKEDLLPSSDSARGHEVVAITKSGGTVHMLTTLVRCCGSDGNLTGFRGSASDITARRVAEERLKASEFKYRELVELSPDPVFIHCRGRIEYVNPAGTAFFGASAPEELLGVPVLRLVHPDFRTEVSERISRLYVEGKPTGAAEMKFVRLDGTVLDGEVRAVPCAFDGKPAAQVLLRDITWRKKAEVALARNEAELSAIYQNAPVMMCLLDENRRIQSANRAAAAFAGRSEESLVGERSDALVGCLNSRTDPRGCGHGPACSGCSLRKALADAANGTVHRRLEVRPQYVRGEPNRDTVLLASIARVIIAGRTYILACFEDVTEQRKLEEQFRQAQKMEAVGQLAGGVAHDFNNILAANLMQIYLMRRDASFSPELLEAINSMERDTRRAAMMTRQLLLFSRREAPQIKNLDLNEIIDQMLKMMRRLLGEQIEIEFNSKTNRALIEADPGMMDQVIMNLCVNARDAMANGGTLTLTTEEAAVGEDYLRWNPEARVGNYVRLSVHDTGSGMDSETVKRIFEPFFTTKDVGKGTGLGLATVFGIVKQHHGWIEVETTLHEGSTFVVYLPQCGRMTASAQPATEAAAMQGSKETILLVEDEPSLRFSLREVLRRLGYVIIEAEDGQAALRQWELHKDEISLLFSDMVMPGGKSGLDLARRMREDRADLRVIVSSGYSTEIAGQMDELSTLDIRFLQKPYTGAIVASAVHECLRAGKR
jgi:PAS domain S-box-containing protein